MQQQAEKQSFELVIGKYYCHFEKFPTSFKLEYTINDSLPEEDQDFFRFQITELDFKASEKYYWTFSQSFDVMCLNLQNVYQSMHIESQLITINFSSVYGDNKRPNKFTICALKTVPDELTKFRIENKKLKQRLRVYEVERKSNPWVFNEVANPIHFDVDSARISENFTLQKTLVTKVNEGWHSFLCQNLFLSKGKYGYIIKIQEIRSGHIIIGMGLQSIRELPNAFTSQDFFGLQLNTWQIHQNGTSSAVAYKLFDHSFKNGDEIQYVLDLDNWVAHWFVNGLEYLKWFIHPSLKNKKWVPAVLAHDAGMVFDTKRAPQQ